MVDVASGSSNEHVQCCCRLPRGSQDCVYKVSADRELFIWCGTSDWVTSLLRSLCCLAVCCAAEFSSWVLFGGIDCIWLAGRGLFFWQVGVTLVMATKSAAAAGGQAGITFGVELVVPWDAQEAVVELHSDGVMDLDTVPDVIGLTGRRPGAAVCRILQGRDVRSVCALVPDSRGLERDFHDITIVDMGDLPESSVSMDELSLLRRQWPPTVLRHMVWLQQDLDTMRVEAKKRFRNTRPGKCSYCDKWIKCDMYCHVATYHFDLASCGGAQCPGARCGRARHRIAWIMFGGA